MALASACGGTGATLPTQIYPATGLVLLSLDNGSVRRSATVGSDPVAVTVSDDGHAAFVADSAPGDVYALRLPALSMEWKQHVGGAPFGLLLHNNSLFVSLFDSAVVDELDPSSGRLLSTHPTRPHPAALAIDPSGTLAVAAEGRFGIATVGSDVWGADYKRQELIDITTQRHVPLPLPVSPFWLGTASNDTLLIAAEGADEDADPGAVISYSTMDSSFHVLARPRDPDQVIESASTVVVAAHGDRQVLVIHGGQSSAWARGASAVALAPDRPLGLLIVVVNSHE